MSRSRCDSAESHHDLIPLFEHDLRANAFRACREAKPVSPFPDRALETQMVRIFAREFKIDIALLVQPLMRTIAQGSRIECETIAHDRSSRSHATGPNVFACVGIETHRIVNRNIIPHGLFSQLIATRRQASVTIVWCFLGWRLITPMNRRCL
jgi:hypothetical protein